MYLVRQIPKIIEQPGTYNCVFLVRQIPEIIEQPGVPEETKGYTRIGTELKAFVGVGNLLLKHMKYTFGY